MKKQNDQKTEKILVYSAVALIIIAIVCGVYLVIDLSGVLEAGSEAETSSVSAVETTEYVPYIEHEDVETKLNSDGTLKQVVYYKDNTYDGCIDYLYQGDTLKEIYLDKDNKAYQIITKKIDYTGNVIFESISDGNETLMETEYVYYDDVYTVWKKTVTEYTDGKTVSTKLLHDEMGQLTDKYIYEDGVEMSHTVYTYDENGEILSESEVSE